MSEVVFKGYAFSEISNHISLTYSPYCTIDGKYVNFS